MRGCVDDAISAGIRPARREGRETLFEHEVFEIATALGVRVPFHRIVNEAGALDDVDLAAFAGDRIVVKVISGSILHKSDVQGVEIVPRDRPSVTACLERMRARFADRNDIAGYGLFEFVPYDNSLGGELLVGIRSTDDFGPILTVGPGGVRAEYLADAPGGGFSPVVLPADPWDASIAASLLERRRGVAMSTRAFRGNSARISTRRLVSLLGKLAEFAVRFVPQEVAELEINPLALTDDGPVALDGLIRLSNGAPAVRPARPLEKIGCLLEPDTIAVFGVSDRMNPGHVIVDNMIREGFPRDRIAVVKPGRDEIMGCRCYPDLESLPGTIDLCILGIDASQIPETVSRIIEARKAESLIVIPGGMGERRGTEHLVQSMQEALDRSRGEAWRGPVINGGNCLGVRSKPGGFDTTFVPRHKTATGTPPDAPLAIISQSGAFTVSKISKWADLDPRYVISVGNQLDLTVGDYLNFLAGDSATRVFACYVEGFRPGDGRDWLRAARRITSEGRTVILYRGGRTPDGARAGVSHTAAVAGDYTVTRELAEQAGVVVADTLSEFEDLVELFCRLDGRAVPGPRLGALTNAGFECVTIADSLGGFRLAEFSGRTRARLNEIFERCRLDRVVDVTNPVDTTPIMGDRDTEEAVRAMLDDPGVDVGIVGCVPHTGALTTLPPGDGHSEDLGDEASIASGLIRLFAETVKPWVVVIDAGPLYDPLARRLGQAGIPVFRSADRALRMLDRFRRARR